MFIEFIIMIIIAWIWIIIILKILNKFTFCIILNIHQFIILLNMFIETKPRNEYLGYYQMY